MWQIEDLIRAYGLNLDMIQQNIIVPYPVSEAEKKSLFEWYESLIEMMRLENIQQEGHLQLNKNVLSELNEFHLQMLSSGKDAGYSAKFYYVLPLINQLRKQQNAQLAGDIEICFNFQYAIMLLRMKKLEITPETLQAQSEISKFMVLLNKFYQQFKNGDLTFDE